MNLIFVCLFFKTVQLLPLNNQTEESFEDVSKPKDYYEQITESIESDGHEEYFWPDEEIHDGNLTNQFNDKEELNNLYSIYSTYSRYTPENSEVKNHLKQFLNLDISTEDVEIPKNFIPPQFINDLYHVVTDPVTGITIRNNPHDAKEVWSIPEENSATPGLFKFDLSGLGENAVLIEAELHIYRIGLEYPTSIHHPPYYLLRVYQVMSPSNTISLNPDIHQLLNVHYVSSFGTGWQVFKIKRAVDSWQNASAPNLGLLVTATTILNEPVDVRFARKDFHSDKYQPTLILYLDDKKSMMVPSEEIKLNKRSIESSEECIKKSMYVDFEQLGLNNAIIAPKGFETFQCSGKCNFSLTKEHNPTNHAVFQSAMEFLGYTSQGSCCVPINTESLSILLVNEKLYVKLFKFNNMVVTKCGCR